MSTTARLRGHGRFAAVRAAGSDARVRGVRVSAAPNSLDVCRIGVAAPGMATAISRNRVRRRLREAGRPLLAVHAGFDLILSAGAAGVELAFSDLRAAVIEAAQRAVTRSRGVAGARSDRPRAQNGANDSTAPAPAGRELIP